MNYEKSCGAVIWRSLGGKREYLIILNKKSPASGHWGFPKGHIEADESEADTARREILEEVGLKIESFIDGFRQVSRYYPAPGVKKDAVYFLAEAPDSEVHIQESELGGFLWLEYDMAKKRLNHDVKILDAAEKFLEKREK